MANLGKIVYLSAAQKDTLFANGSVTVGGTTITYSANDLYLTPETPVTSVNSKTGAVTVRELPSVSSSDNDKVLKVVSGTDCDVAWEDIGWKLLWTNANPTSTFVEQTVALDLTEYSDIRVIFYATKASAASSTGSVLYSFEYPKTGVSSQYYRMNALHNTGSGSAAAWISRDLQGSDAGVFISSGGVKNTNVTTAMSTNNEVLIPFIIYAR